MLVSEEVAEALADGRPVVALESTIISHGLPRPRNLEAARDFEALLRERGVTPATIAVLDGVPRVGLDEAGVERIAMDDMAKASIRDLPVLAGRGASAATTVASTVHLAARAGVRVFATGGLGGVHRGASTTYDESADLGALAVPRRRGRVGGGEERARRRRHPGAAGDVERAGGGLRHRCLPELLAARVGVPPRLAGRLRRGGRRRAGRAGPRARGRCSPAGLVVANPVPADEQWDPVEHDRVLAEAFAAADAAGVRGKEVTPFLLAFIVDASGGRSLEVNLALARNNVRVAADVATAYAARRDRAG